MRDDWWRQWDEQLLRESTITSPTTKGRLGGKFRGPSARESLSFPAATSRAQRRGQRESRKAGLAGCIVVHRTGATMQQRANMKHQPLPLWVLHDD